jgi:hypothetical protein
LLQVLELLFQKFDIPAQVRFAQLYHDGHFEPKGYCGADRHLAVNANRYGNINRYVEHQWKGDVHRDAQAQLRDLNRRRCTDLLADGDGGLNGDLQVILEGNHRLYRDLLIDLHGVFDGCLVKGFQFLEGARDPFKSCVLQYQSLLAEDEQLPDAVTAQGKGEDNEEEEQKDDELGTSTQVRPPFTFDVSRLTLYTDLHPI